MPRMSQKEEFDIVIIGAGIGGLACATYLAKQGLKVLIVEQHYVVGGYCHSFRRRSFIFDSAVEYIGCCGKGQDITRALDLLGAQDHVSFCELDRNGYDRLIFPKHTIHVCRGIDRYVDRLTSYFPREHRALRKYTEVLKAIWKEVHIWGLGLYVWERGKYPCAAAFLRRYSGKTLWDLFQDAGIRSAELRGILSGQSGNYALPPSRVDLATYAIIIMHLHEGAYYPRGGVQKLPDALVTAFKGYGGSLHTRREVKAIEVRNGKVVWIRLVDGRRIYTRIIVSNADAKLTFLELLKGVKLPERQIKKIEKTRPSLSSLQVYLGVTADSVERRLTAANYWVCPTYDFERLYDDLECGRKLSKKYFLLSCMSLKDDSGALAPPGYHVMKLLAPISGKLFGEWNGTRLGQRGREYEELKEELSDELILEAETVVPQLRSAIRLKVIGTPLTNNYYTKAMGGAMYGPARTPDQSGPYGLTPRTGIEGLFLTGTSTYYPGILGALGSGIMTGIDIIRNYWKLLN